MKESEAKTKWCPMARPCGDYEDEYGNNRAKTGVPAAAAMCIGSDCMMWVQEVTNRDHREYGDGRCGLVK